MPCKSVEAETPAVDKGAVEQIFASAEVIGELWLEPVGRMQARLGIPLSAAEKFEADFFAE